MARATGSGGYGIGVMRGFDCGTEDVAPGQAQAGATLNSDVATGHLLSPTVAMWQRVLLDELCLCLRLALNSILPSWYTPACSLVSSACRDMADPNFPANLDISPLAIALSQPRAGGSRSNDAPDQWGQRDAIQKYGIAGRVWYVRTTEPDPIPPMLAVVQTLIAHRMKGGYRTSD